MKLCQRETVSTANLDGFQTIAYPDFPKHAMNVVFHGLLRKTQFLRNLFVRASAADHSYQLLLTASQSKLVFCHKIGERSSLTCNIPEQYLAQFRRAHRAAPGDG